MVNRFLTWKPRPFNGEKLSFQQMIRRKMSMQKNEVGPLLKTYKKKRIKDLNSRAKTIKPLKENRGKSL